VVADGVVLFLFDGAFVFIFVVVWCCLHVRMNRNYLLNVELLYELATRGVAVEDGVQLSRKI